MSIILTICISGKSPVRREPYEPGYVSGNIEATNVASHLEQRAASIRFRARTETQQQPCQFLTGLNVSPPET
jgi:hypothetical protein